MMMMVGNTGSIASTPEYICDALFERGEARLFVRSLWFCLKIINLILLFVTDNGVFQKADICSLEAIFTVAVCDHQRVLAKVLLGPDAFLLYCVKIVWYKPVVQNLLSSRLLSKNLKKLEYTRR
jgi:hypothetical protein